MDESGCAEPTTARIPSTYGRFAGSRCNALTGSETVKYLRTTRRLRRSSRGGSEKLQTAVESCQWIGAGSADPARQRAAGGRVRSGSTERHTCDATVLVRGTGGISCPQ